MPSSGEQHANLIFDASNMALISLDVYAVFFGLSLFYLAYGLCVAVYRIYLSPLSHIPGPKIAIATSWYECFYDVWKRGVYYRKVKEFHQKYGQI